MRKLIVVWVALAVLGGATVRLASAQTQGVDTQVRFVSHLQFGVEERKDGKVSRGWAIWANLPDLTATSPGRWDGASTFIVGGVALGHPRRAERSAWVDLLVGARVGEVDGYVDWVANTRFAFPLGRLGISGDVEFYPRENRRRLYWWLAADARIPSTPFRVGAETENINRLLDHPDGWGLGPRISWPKKLPHERVWFRTLAVSAAYEWRWGRRSPKLAEQDFARLYVVLAR